MKKWAFIGGFLFLVCMGWLTACSKEETTEPSSMEMASEELHIVEDHAAPDGMMEEESMAENRTSRLGFPENGRKLIYHANLQVEVKNLDDSITAIHDKTETLQGYVVESMVQARNAEFDRVGHMTVRVPQDHLQEFIAFVEEASLRVRESSISGQDVTEEYVDLETRLESKRMVEERLLIFMEEAEKTEDLLLISSDLARIQEEIEEIKGKMQYLDNKIDLATVTVYLEEHDVSLGGGKDLDIWEKTKEQFVKSIQLLLTSLSSLFIFFVGNIPIFASIGVVGLIIYLWIRRRKRKNKEG